MNQNISIHYKGPLLPIECASPLGIKIGLIDSIMTLAKVVEDKMMESNNEPEFIEALQDLYENKSLRFILQYAKTLHLIK